LLAFVFYSYFWFSFFFFFFFFSWFGVCYFGHFLRSMVSSDFPGLCWLFVFAWLPAICTFAAVLVDPGGGSPYATRSLYGDGYDGFQSAPRLDLSSVFVGFFFFSPFLALDVIYESSLFLLGLATRLIWHNMTVCFDRFLRPVHELVSLRSWRLILLFCFFAAG